MHVPVSLLIYISAGTQAAESTHSMDFKGEVTVHCRIILLLLWLVEYSLL